MEGTKVQDIILDTGCSRTMIRKDLVPRSKWRAEEAVTIRCAHGDTEVYPVASVELNVEGIPMKVEAALSDTLPAAVLLGRDVPELDILLDRRRGRGRSEQTGDVTEEAMAVTTRSKAKNEAQERENRGKAGQDEREHWNIGNSLDDSLFEFRPTSMRVRLSRASKRENKRQFRRNVQEKAYPNDGEWNNLNFGVD